MNMVDRLQAEWREDAARYDEIVLHYHVERLKVQPERISLAMALAVNLGGAAVVAVVFALIVFAAVAVGG